MTAETKPIGAMPDDLVERLRSAGGCPFCGQDPYHYVDTGVGMARVAVECCDLGIGLIQYGDEQLQREIALRCVAADAIDTLTADLAAARAEIGVLREALKPFGAIAFYYDGQRHDGVSRWDDDRKVFHNLTVGDFRRARSILQPGQGNASEGGAS